MTMTHNQDATIKAHKAGLTLARAGETRAYVNDVARTLPVDEADALLAGYYRETRRLADNRSHYARVERNWLSDI
jgi:hypothetical protein